MATDEENDNALFPPLTRAYILAFQFSSWYPAFSAHSIKSTIIRPLSAEFREYLDADGVFVPEGSEDARAESTLSDDEKDADEEEDQDGDRAHADKECEDEDNEDNEDEDDEDTRRKHYAFPELDARIRECIRAYDAVFPKLNFTSPRDAAWLLPASSPLKCTSPADVYLLLKSSDFITHDLSLEAVFEGITTAPTSAPVPAPLDAAVSLPEASSAGSTDLKADSKTDSKEEPYELELVLRKWYPVDRSRELRCFVRDGVLLAISQRDTNFYEFWNDATTQARVRRAVCEFWETHVRPKVQQQDYIFDLLLTRDLARAHIVDFNPYARKTDPLLFSYEELAALRQLHHQTQLHHQSGGGGGGVPVHRRDAGGTTPTPGGGGEEGREKGNAGKGKEGQHGAGEGAITQDNDARGKEEKETEDKEPGPASKAHASIPSVLPVLRVIDSAAHPAATSSAPAHQHNMIPFEAVSLSSGRDIEEFADKWQASVKESMRND